MNTNSKTSKSKKPFTPVISQEVTHYEVEFAQWLKENVSRDTYKAVYALGFLQIAARNELTEEGQKDAERSRRTLQKFCTKYAPRKAA